MLYDKRDKLSYFILRMSHFPVTSPAISIYIFFIMKLIRSDRCTPLYSDFIHKKSEFYNSVAAKERVSKQLEKQSSNVLKTPLLLSIHD